MEELRVADVKGSKHCELCGYPHFSVEVYIDWIERFGQWHVFKEGKKAGRPTQRTAQTQRWETIVAKHATDQPAKQRSW
jgi:hypothetical protein